MGREGTIIKLDEREGEKRKRRGRKRIMTRETKTSRMKREGREGGRKEKESKRR